MKLDKRRPKRPKERSTKTLVCPRCGGTDIHRDLPTDLLVFGHSCRGCGYQGTFIIEDGEEADG